MSVEAFCLVAERLEVQSKIGDRLIALRAILAQRLGHDTLELVRQARVHAIERHGLALEHRGENVAAGPPVNGGRPATSSYRITPSAQMSARASTS